MARAQVAAGWPPPWGTFVLNKGHFTFLDFPGSGYLAHELELWAH